MLSSLRSKMNDLHADNVFELVIELKVFILSVDGVVHGLRLYETLNARMAQVALRNLTLKFEVDALGVIITERWPMDMDQRISFIKADLILIEEALEVSLSLLNDQNEPRAHVSKIMIERLLS
jgi:hypothetical protein